MLKSCKCFSFIWILTKSYQSLTRDGQSQSRGGSFHSQNLHLCDALSCWVFFVVVAGIHGPSPFSAVGRLCGFIQSEPGTTLDDPWPTGCIKGFARTPLTVHVSQSFNTRLALKACPTEFY